MKQPSLNNQFLQRHIGLSDDDQSQILTLLGYKNLDDFIHSVVPAEILDNSEIDFLPNGCDEFEALAELQKISSKNELKRSLIGLGYHGTVTPSLIQRHVLENPSWYTSYTPYQAEISQGRLEALFNFQTLISELTGLPIANASMLDEATAAAEAMSLSFSVKNSANAKVFLVDQSVLPQTYAVLKTRAEPLHIVLQEVDPRNCSFEEDVFGLFIQLPSSNGHLWDPSLLIKRANKAGALVTVAIDPLAQSLIKSVGDLGADIAIGSAQRFGVPMGFGGPHAAFFATKEIYKRQVPGRIVGQSVDANGQPALRLALQTREQHIRRDRATSNICTAQVLLAILSSFFAIYHGPSGIQRIAERVVKYRAMLEKYLIGLGYKVDNITRFDTIEVYCNEATDVHIAAQSSGFNFRLLPIGVSIKDAKGFAITLDELTNDQEIYHIYNILESAKGVDPISYDYGDLDISRILFDIPLRDDKWLAQPIFSMYKTETELLRYIQRLSVKDFSLVHGMIPLGSCTMKLNAASELIPISWKEFSSLHPFAPKDQSLGYQSLINDLESWLSLLTGFAGVSLQPNAGSQGEFAGLLVIRKWHESKGDSCRNICLIPSSAHGTNPASAVMAGFTVVPINCDQAGNIDLEDLIVKGEKYSDNLAAIMITYPSTHGVFEPNIRDICQIVHNHGGQVYLDGANLNAQVGVCRPGNYGADVCHLNLHKTFCIPHGGGGPGVGPIAVAKHLLPYLPGHPLLNNRNQDEIGAISSAPYGSAGILPISWMYIRMMGFKGLKKASSVAMLSANYLSKRLDNYFPVLFKGPNNLVAHECILDLRPIKRSSGIEVDDIAKRLMDYGFHAPTVSWPVAGTLMVEPTESESYAELNRFCDAMISIRQEIQAIEAGNSDGTINPLRLAPHTLNVVIAEDWDRPYSRHQAAFPLKDQINNKFWPSVSRIDNVFGDRNLVCSCTSMEDLIDN